MAIGLPILSGVNELGKGHAHAMTTIHYDDHHYKTQLDNQPVMMTTSKKKLNFLKKLEKTSV